MARRTLSHTADAGVEATADSFPDLVEELLAAMFESMSDLAGLTAQRWVEARVEADTTADLVVDALSEALYVSEVENLMLCDFEAGLVPGGLELRLGGVPVRDTHATGAAIKAVTYHRLTVEERPDGWYGRVFFDV